MRVILCTLLLYGNTCLSQYDNYGLLRQSLEYKQRTVNTNIDKIQNEIAYINNMISTLYQLEDNLEVANRIDRIVKTQNEMLNYISKVNSVRPDYSSNAVTNQILNGLSYYKNTFKGIINEVIKERENTISRINHIIDYYNSSRSVPTVVVDGWHNVYSTNKKDFCEVRKVYVRNNKITNYYVGDEHRTIEFTRSIEACKTSLKLTESNDVLIIFFIEYISK